MPDVVRTARTNVSASPRQEGRSSVCFLWRSLLAACCAAQSLFGQATVLAQVKGRVQNDLTKLPNYICTETIEQSRISHDRCSSGDCGTAEMNRFRVDVGFVEGRQIFGWPGGERLSDSDISRLVPDLVTDGDVVVFARLLLLSNPTLTGERREDHDGRATIRYDYFVPLDNSGWVFRRDGDQLRVAYHGTFWVDATTLDVVELQMTAESIPPELHVKAVERTLRYRPARIGSRDFLLPNRAVLTAADVNGNLKKTEARFDNCRQYTAESFLQYPAKIQSQLPRNLHTSRQSVLLPDDFVVELSLETEIDSDDAAVGDLVVSRVRREAGKRRGFPVSADSLLHGRISRVEGLNGYHYLEILFSHLEVNGTSVDIRSRRNQLVVRSGSRWIPAPIRGTGRIRLLRGQVVFFRSTTFTGG